MATVLLTHITNYCERLLHTAKFEDWPEAVNGLQMANRGTVSRIAATVDATLSTIKMAIDQKADLLLVHHGLFWGPTHPWTGKRYELIKLLIENNLAVYSSHLPLDAHPRLGNNAQLCQALGLRKCRPFFFEKGQNLGLRGTLNISREELARRLEQALGRQTTLLPCGPATCREIGVVTGGAGSRLKLAAAEGVDTFITGEGPHWTYAQAEEVEISVFYGGHYATETFGVKALARQLARKFKLPWSFIDYPTGL